MHFWETFILLSNNAAATTSNVSTHFQPYWPLKDTSMYRHTTAQVLLEVETKV